MKSKTIMAYCVGLLLLLTVAPAVTYAAVPQLINYQGKLMEDGAPTNGFRMMIFSIWDNDIGGDPTSALWNETQTIEVTEGIYNVELGSNTALPANLYDYDDLYLQVDILHPTSGWQRLSPLLPFDSTMFAIKAAKAEDANTLDGKDSTEFADTSHSHSFSDITGTAADSQIPDNITIHHANYAGHADTAYAAYEAITAQDATHAIIADNAFTADNADMVDDLHASAFASSSHTHDGRYYTESEVDSKVASMQSQITSLQASVNQLTTLLQNVTRSGNDITFEGVNVHIVNGSGTTYGTPDGLGNLIVGYNELRGTDDDRSGSHNIVVGTQHNYSSYGGLVVGRWNKISGPYASVSGGYRNTASEYHSSVSGGHENTASHMYSSVSGSSGNTANGSSSSVSGGYGNTASSSASSVSGGGRNTASGNTSSVSGGLNNTANGSYSFVGGGGDSTPAYGNIAFGHFSAVLGGFRNIAGDPALSDHYIGQSSTVSGGSSGNAKGDHSSVSGGQWNKAYGDYSSVTGGNNCTAGGDHSSISSGSGQSVSGQYDWKGGHEYFSDY